MSQAKHYLSRVLLKAATFIKKKRKKKENQALFSCDSWRLLHSEPSIIENHIFFFFTNTNREKLASWRFWAISDSTTSPTSVCWIQLRQEGEWRVYSYRMLGMNYQVRPMASKLINVGEVETFSVVSVSVVIMYPDHQFENHCAQVFIWLSDAQIATDWSFPWELWPAKSCGGKPLNLKWIQMI